MKMLLTVAGVMLALTTASEAQQRSSSCVDRFKYVWGFDTSTTGKAKAGVACNTSFSYRRAKTTGAEVVQAPSHGTVAIRRVGDGRPVITYTPKLGYAGPDTFAVRLRGVTLGRAGDERPEAATKVTYNMMVRP